MDSWGQEQDEGAAPNRGHEQYSTVGNWVVQLVPSMRTAAQSPLCVAHTQLMNCVHSECKRTALERWWPKMSNTRNMDSKQHSASDEPTSVILMLGVRHLDLRLIQFLELYSVISVVAYRDKNAYRVLAKAEQILNRMIAYFVVLWYSVGMIVQVQKRKVNGTHLALVYGVQRDT
ncbi:hypothetical protein BU24DRAFT_410965 [Aaosphaeria arxii CBS 175.79]|uniref:Uncharacterized protein n=1 Tax=Aaosphaeria arxii CBS 175.79 TaxID=1450172 RepID=A0A6A5XIT5_9PLEO|nr:uncharacterized protein BU24DRAFT_410965 [Aaosphaeria arxii CBS 175.79]KAF2013195.1 hypothetical protein BU24DRAFT_410965 [Aaosphaeria arxii CBS 175.79]